MKRHWKEIWQQLKKPKDQTGSKNRKRKTKSSKKKRSFDDLHRARKRQIIRDAYKLFGEGMTEEDVKKYAATELKKYEAQATNHFDNEIASVEQNLEKLEVRREDLKENFVSHVKNRLENDKSRLSDRIAKRQAKIKRLEDKIRSNTRELGLLEN